MFHKFYRTMIVNKNLQLHLSLRRYNLNTDNCYKNLRNNNLLPQDNNLYVHKVVSAIRQTTIFPFFL